jgi:hypothetical protein
MDYYNDSTDWKQVTNESGLVVEYKVSERGVNVIRASKVL